MGATFDIIDEIADHSGPFVSEVDVMRVCREPAAALSARCNNTLTTRVLDDDA
jgi:hypothetical protein